MPNYNYIKCNCCGKILDPEGEACFLDGKDYCLDHYEERIKIKQDIGLANK